jgi:hypothetical protein
MTYKIAVVVGSIRRESFNKQLAHAVASLAPPDFSFEFLDIAGLPLYSQDYDSDFPEVARIFKQKIAAAGCVAIRDAGIQPLDSRRPEECAGLGFAAVGSQRLGQ